MKPRIVIECESEEIAQLARDALRDWLEDFFPLGARMVEEEQ